MSESGFRKIGVIGIGTMGNGIAQVAAQSGFEVVVMDVDATVLGERGVHHARPSFVAPPIRLVSIHVSAAIASPSRSGFIPWRIRCAWSDASLSLQPALLPYE